MRDKVLIYAGLLLVLILLTYPVWQGLAGRTVSAGPQLPQLAKGKHCVAPVTVMKKAHMQLLMAWRQGKVRHQQDHYTAYDGTRYRVSLTGTCLAQCHGNKEDFCERCHAYAGVAPLDCWGCHTSPAKAMAKTPGAAQEAQ
jgi:[DsrC]-trisulfide reductase subunit J